MSGSMLAYAYFQSEISLEHALAIQCLTHETQTEVHVYPQGFQAAPASIVFA